MFILKNNLVYFDQQTKLGLVNRSQSTQCQMSINTVEQKSTKH